MKQRRKMRQISCFGKEVKNNNYKSTQPKNIIYVEGLKSFLVDPNWFCHHVMEFVINFKGITHGIEKWFATKTYMNHTLRTSLNKITKKISSKRGIHIQPNDLMHLMFNLNICYTKDHANLDDGIFVLIILDVNFANAKKNIVVEGRYQLE
jgi:hypothetical protein